ncbi:MAG: amidohydrolase family protein, partial [Firmicutes bacterium]|nr:amidohydrolase family protein [Candidatus Fermentithermobacillaceae bacterium]
SMAELYRCGTLIDGKGGPPVKNAAVLVDSGRIAGVLGPGDGATEFIAKLSDERPDIKVVDLGGYTVLPGLIDMHVHVDYWYSHPNRAEYEDETGDAMAACLAARNIRSTLEKGITTVRDLASGVGLKMRRAVELGYVPGSRIFTSAKGISMTGGHGSDGYKSCREADGPEEVRKAVREQIKAGANLIKILTSHRSEHPEYRQEELDAGVDEAHRRGYWVACHAAIMPSCKMAVLAGVDTIEHGTHLTDEVREMMAERGVYLIPTMIAYHTMAKLARKAKEDPEGAGDFRREFLAKHADWWIRTGDMLESQFRKAAAAGIKMAVGTDLVVPDVEFSPYHEEIEFFVEYGYGEMNTICAATRVAAEALGKADDLGTIEKGKIADFIAVEGDPLQDIKALRNVKLVVKDGRVEVPAPVPYYTRWGK